MSGRPEVILSLGALKVKQKSLLNMVFNSLLERLVWECLTGKPDFHWCLLTLDSDAVPF